MDGASEIVSCTGFEKVGNVKLLAAAPDEVSSRMDPANEPSP